ncbi:hypothetical protein JNB85_13565 [Rhizobium mesosinicum]|uniref:Twin-arginine translocation signal domain-containing protein n=2 Tax=Rhizobium mesosinicum TaxID=335017 RepID=A0ABS7GU04_9HYPH|nr:hypothetical protein [Rhizobium mesosinicum]
MPNATIQAAAEGMPNTTRRNLLIGLATASTAAAVAVASKAHAVEAAPEAQAENPELIAAYDTFYSACTELKNALSDAEWLADEWRHRWPLAPEELLLNAGAQHPYTAGALIERDIIGRPLLRETSPITKRLSRNFRERTRKTCFTLLTADKARELLSRWEQSEPRGRTEKSLSRNIAFRREAIADCKRDIDIAEQYEAETARIRKEAGADAAMLRVEEADRAVDAAAAEVSLFPAYTVAGVGLKAAALSVSAHRIIKECAEDKGPIGQFIRLAQSVRDLSEARA